METTQIMQAFYETREEEARLLTRCGRVEYLTTMRCIQRYLKPGARILEVGAGTGQYSRALAAMGYRVDAVELVEHNIRIFRQNITPDMQIAIRQGTAADLSAYASETFDLVLLLGPLYHLFTEEDKLQALSEAVRVTRKGGIVFAAYCMADASILQHGFLKGNIRALLEKGMVDPDTFAAHSEPEDVFELHRKADIDRLRSHFNVTQLHYISTDGYANHMRGALEEMDEETYQIYLRYHFATCEIGEMTGISNHTLDIFQKK